MKIFRIVRSNDWWEYKIPPLLAIGYATALLFHLPIIEIIPSLLFLTASLITGAVYVSVLNDVTDIKEDLAIGKTNQMARFSPRIRWIFPAICFSAGVVFMFLFRHDRLSLALYISAWIAFSLYSLPPFRLKKRAASGVIADAAGAHLFPSLLMVSAITNITGSNIHLFWFLAVGLWSLSYGLRGILWHQFQDRKNDLQTGVPTFAAGTNPDTFRRKAGILTIVEIFALGFLLYLLFAPVVWLFLALCLVLLYVRIRYYGAKIVSVVAPGDSPYHILFSDYYQFFLPVSVLISDALVHSWTWILVIIQLILFPNTTRIAIRDLYGACRHFIRIFWKKSDSMTSINHP